MERRGRRRPSTNPSQKRHLAERAMAPPELEEAQGASASTPALDAHFLELVITAAEQRNGEQLRALLKPVPPADLADIIENAPDHARKDIITLIGADLPPEMLLELSEDVRGEILSLLPPDFIGRALGE